jgi:hypothetical protein
MTIESLPLITENIANYYIVITSLLRFIAVIRIPLLRYIITVIKSSFLRIITRLRKVNCEGEQRIDEGEQCTAAATEEGVDGS